MARIKVGDIVIDGDQIVIGGEPIYSHSQTTVQTQVVSSWGSSGTALTKTNITNLQKIPGTPSFQNSLVRPPSTGLQKRTNDPFVWVVGGTAVGITATLFYYLTSAPFFPAAALAGFVFVIVGFVRYFQEKSNKKIREEQQEQEYRSNTRLLKTLLKDPKPEQTIEWIVAKTGWSEAVVVKTLSWLSKRGALQEEVDLQTGDWYYYIPVHDRLAVEDDLASRVKRIERGISE